MSVTIVILSLLIALVSSLATFVLAIISQAQPQWASIKEQLWSLKPRPSNEAIRLVNGETVQSSDNAGLNGLKKMGILNQDGKRPFRLRWIIFCCGPIPFQPLDQYNQ